MFLVLCAGCEAGSTPKGTGAHDAAQTFFDAVLRKDWPRAYAALDPEVCRSIPVAVFEQRAASYRRNIGFEPTAVQFRACEERGDEATAHVAFSGRGSGRFHFYKDAAMLRRSATGWGVVLPQRFGAAR